MACPLIDNEYHFCLENDSHHSFHYQVQKVNSLACLEGLSCSSVSAKQSQTKMFGKPLPVAHVPSVGSVIRQEQEAHADPAKSICTPCSKKLEFQRVQLMYQETSGKNNSMALLPRS